MTSKNQFHLSRLITLLACAGFASAVAIRVCDPMLPEIAQSFGTTNGQAAGTITAFAIAYGLCQLIYGPLGDRYDKYRLILFATFACIIGSQRSDRSIARLAHYFQGSLRRHCSRNYSHVHGLDRRQCTLC